MTSRRLRLVSSERDEGRKAVQPMASEAPAAQAQGVRSDCEAWAADPAVHVSRSEESGAEPEPWHGEDAATPSSTMSAPSPRERQGKAPDPMLEAIDLILTRLEERLAKLRA